MNKHHLSIKNGLFKMSLPFLEGSVFFSVKLTLASLRKKHGDIIGLLVWRPISCHSSAFIFSGLLKFHQWHYQKEDQRSEQDGIVDLLLSLFPRLQIY